MATKLAFTQSPSATGDYAITFASSPLGGFNAQVSLGTATSATIQLYVRTHSTAQYILADTLNLSSGGATTLNTPVYPPYEDARFTITAIAGGTVNLTAIGVGA
jgi:hypothetical protein